MSEMKHSTVLNVDGKDISNDEAKSAARKERLKQPIAQASIEGEIQAIKAIVGDNPKAPFEKERESKMKSFQLSFDRPLLVKFFIQTFPDDATTDSQTLAAYAKEKDAPQLTIDMLELLTVDEMKACDDTEANIQAAATTLQTKMFGELEAADIDAAQATFDQLKVYCDDQAKRLGDLTLSS
ncbi:hypothetical protein TrLO_g10946 [Triparma laevis f. longispina]|uniref:Uncharacterized protein n=1 Tax=Triparma laevis f. longispina TaxID=1714387 RepID=A0A9W7E9S4_9STRA|nr:hypothetical protein TrLO_g10946 [Triparma laevis f. longispina]